MLYMPTPYTQGTQAALDFYKIAVRIPVIHGTSGRWDVLKPGIGNTVLRNDPNPRAVYVGTANRKIRTGIDRFAREAVTSRGGEAVRAHAKIDTKKGWGARTLTAWGRENIGDVDDIQAIIDELDSGINGPRRGELWQKIQRGVGSWVNEDPTTTVRPNRYTKVR